MQRHFHVNFLSTPARPVHLLFSLFNRSDSTSSRPLSPATCIICFGRLYFLYCHFREILLTLSFFTFAPSYRKSSSNSLCDFSGSIYWQKLLSKSEWKPSFGHFQTTLYLLLASVYHHWGFLLEEFPTCDSSVFVTGHVPTVDLWKTDGQVLQTWHSGQWKSDFVCQC